MLANYFVHIGRREMLKSRPSVIRIWPRRTRVIVKLLENSPLSLRDQRLDSWLLSTGFSYSLGLPTINVGYQRYSNASLHGHSLFFQGNFDW